jgi:hypothetical protein
VLAGIGQSFAAARLAVLLPGAEPRSLEIAVETGISGFDPLAAHPFLLSADNIALSTRLSSVEDNLGALACGRENRCLAVIGGAEVDGAGNVNSSSSRGRLLVGSGGASDLTASAREVVVLCRAERLVGRVEFVTSPGRRVRAIVTEDGVLERDAEDAPWLLSGVGLGPCTADEVLSRLPFPATGGDVPAPIPSDQELRLLSAVLEGREATSLSQTPGAAHA